MITASLKTNLILKELGITRFSSRSSANKSIINSIYIYKIDKVSVFLKKDFKEYDIDQKKLILAIMNSTTLTNGKSSGQSILFDNKNVPNALISSFIVTIPATIIPITIAAFAAYAFAWMQFPGRDWLFVIVVSLMVVPTQLAFLPILQGFSGIASWATALNQWVTDCELTDSCQVASKSFASLWITHTAFGLPLAIYLLRNYIVGLPKELLQSARIDGASHLQIFTRLIIPLSVPALASFSIFQFLWVWNDLIVALYIGPNNASDLVFPIRLQKQLGTFKDQLHLLNASAVISMIVPVLVFLSMQRYFIRGLLAGSVKGG